MADLFGNGSSNRDIEKVLVALKKGAQLLKYGRKGKPKFYPFRLSTDESLLIWLSSGGEKSLKLAYVSKIIPGQRTPVFQRYLCPEKEYLSFSLIYNNDKRSLDLICKDKVEAEVWFAGLKALISSFQGSRSKIDGLGSGLNFDDAKDLISNSASDSSISTIVDISSPDSNPHPSTLPVISLEDIALGAKSDVTNMQVKGSSSDVFRVSVSSAPSTSSHGSAQDDYDALGDVYVWGDVICDNAMKGAHGRDMIHLNSRSDILLPKPLESNLVLDALHVACGVKHAALVTRQGEVFTWGEESGGRLGHGVEADVIHPHLVESLAACTAEFVACGEFHTCAISVDGELYTWGDGAHNVGLLGHGTDVSHWIPKRVSGPLEGLQVAFVTCGTWHTALITTAGQLFTFGDGTFGVLGHGNRESVSYPREVESLLGLKTVAVACGVWHTAAVVEVIVTQSSSSISSGKLFTWGDGDKYRLGHGDKEPRLKPTCVPSLIDYDFHKLACGHSLTIGLTTSGNIFTMGSTVYGQLGNPHADGKVPCLVEEKLAAESVSEIACGSYHVAVLTSRGEVYTWGKGANGRLGHGDLEDRKTPTLVETLKDRPVKRIDCGSNFTAAICHHKWVSSAEQSQCSACRQAFGFTRKRHNCYNCGLVHCHSCSSRKALRAALAPNPGKPYRVCDSCHVKLNKGLEHGGSNNRRNANPRPSGESRERIERADIKTSKPVLPNNADLIKHLDIKVTKYGKGADSLSLIRPPQGPSLLQLNGIAFAGRVDVNWAIPMAVRTSVQSVNPSRAVSPFSRKHSPSRSATPVPATSGLSFSKGIVDSLKKQNELLNQDVKKLRSQVDALGKRYELQEFELQKSAEKAQEAMTLAAEESAKSKAAKEVIKSLTAQLKDMAERLPPGVYESEEMRSVHLPNGNEPHFMDHSCVTTECQPNSASNGQNMPFPILTNSNQINGVSMQNFAAFDIHEANKFSEALPNRGTSDCERTEENLSTIEHDNTEDMVASAGKAGKFDGRGPEHLQNGEKSAKSRRPVSTGNQVEAEWIEQYEPGVYITLMALRDGTRDLKRVRFSRRRFGEHQAEAWWSENREKVYEKYNVRGSDRASSVLSTQSGT